MGRQAAVPCEQRSAGWLAGSGVVWSTVAAAHSHTAPGAAPMKTARCQPGAAARGSAGGQRRQGRSRVGSGVGGGAGGGEGQLSSEARCCCPSPRIHPVVMAPVRTETRESNAHRCTPAFLGDCRAFSLHAATAWNVALGMRVYASLQTALNAPFCAAELARQVENGTPLQHRQPVAQTSI